MAEPKKHFISQNNFSVSDENNGKDFSVRGIAGCHWYTLENWGNKVIVIEDNIKILPGKAREFPFTNENIKYQKNPRIRFVADTNVEGDPIFGDVDSCLLIIQTFTLCEAEEQDWCNANVK